MKPCTYATDDLELVSPWSNSKRRAAPKHNSDLITYPKFFRPIVFVHVVRAPSEITILRQHESSLLHGALLKLLKLKLLQLESTL